MNLRVPCFLAVVALACSGAEAEIFVIDQQNDPQPITQKDSVIGLVLIQTFRPTFPGIDFADFICNAFEAAPAQLSVRVRDGVGGPILGTSGVVAIPNDNSIDWYRFVFPSRVALTPAQSYALEVIQVGGGSGWIGRTNEDHYPGSIAYWDGVTPKNFDYNFREGIVIPEPAAWVLISLGAIYGFGVRLRR